MRRIAMAMVLLFVGCQGPVGPQGPAGPRGLQGEPGPQVLPIYSVKSYYLDDDDGVGAVMCPQGQRATGGGCYCSQGTVFLSGPTGDNSWACGCDLVTTSEFYVSCLGANMSGVIEKLTGPQELPLDVQARVAELEVLREERLARKP